MICLYSFFPDTAIETNQASAIHALLFVSNRPKTDQENYFQMLSLAEDIFTHTWSLSVEIQFYFLVPFIFLLATKIPEKFQLGYYGLFALASVIFCYSSSATVAFNSVFARIWQFLIGMLVYLLGSPMIPYRQHPQKPEYEVLKLEEGLKSEESEKFLDEVTDNESDKEEEVLEHDLDDIEIPNIDICSKSYQYLAYALLGSLITITAFPWAIPSGIVRPLVTIGTGLLMLVSEGNRILSNSVLTYIGDISYSLYLIHWPIYAYWKLTADGNIYYVLLALVSSVILAIITFETFEKWYLKLSSTSVGCLVVTLFFMNLVVIHKNEISDQIQYMRRNISNLDEVTENMTIDDAEAMNHRWNINDLKNLYVPSCVYESINTPYGWCRHTGLSRLGKYRIVTFGNSWTANHAKLFYQECGYKANSILQGAAYACEPLYVSSPTHPCASNFTTFVERIEMEKPDFGFHFTRHISIGAGFPKNVTTFDKDPIYQMMKAQMLKIIVNIKYKVYLIHAIPSVLPNSVRGIAGLVKKGTERVKIEKMLLRPHGWEMARKRYEQLVRDCNGKCELIDYLPEFYQNSTKTFRYFDDKGFSYWTTDQHFSPHGIEKLRHIWTDLCAKL
ncbi:hypothetical protein B9Z55_015183 [Caenorhabditis nigoni]|nr:hypothetical protein B9Z55_015183 [Caenorhabditis nigoni]